MIWLGLNKHTRGYGTKVREFERTGKPLPVKMRRHLLAEVDRAQQELARIQRALEAK